ncbi:MAG: glycine cleavage T C-terminal barrel domain-containing protein [Planctomycetota bacterium]
MNPSPTLQHAVADLAESVVPFGETPDAPALPTAYGAYQAEYAALKRHVGVCAWPHKTLLQVTGQDRLAFLGNLLSQHVAELQPGQTVDALQLNERGHIVATVRVHHGDAETWLETDHASLGPLQALLDQRLFAEDVQLHDLAGAKQNLSLIGPAALKLLRSVEDDPASAESAQASTVEALRAMPGATHVVRLMGARASATLDTQAGEPAVSLWVDAEHASGLFRNLLDAAGWSPDPDAETDPNRAAEHAQARRASLRGRPVGWDAYNTARIEAGEPWFRIDYGPTNTPHEVGPRLLAQTVSLTKGCWLGQEAVARTENLGRPKRRLIGLRIQENALPPAGAEVRSHHDDPAKRKAVGVVTSSTLSPLLGQAPIALAQVGHAHHKPGTTLQIPAEGRWVAAQTVALPFTP